MQDLQWAFETTHVTEAYTTRVFQAIHTHDEVYRVSHSELVIIMNIKKKQL